jgi:hypothetical protein
MRSWTFLPIALAELFGSSFWHQFLSFCSYGIEKSSREITLTKARKHHLHIQIIDNVTKRAKNATKLKTIWMDEGIIYIRHT